MARYIDADKMIDGYSTTFPYDLSYCDDRDLMEWLNNQPTADVVPKSEVEELSREYESLAKTVNEASELIRKLRSKIAELKKDRYQVFPDGKIELIPRTDIDEIKREVAREIFEDIECAMCLAERQHRPFNSRDYVDYYDFSLEIEVERLKKKYTEGGE